MLILRDTPKAPRQNPELNDGIEALDRKLLLCGGDTEVAFQQLTTAEQEFIAEQLLRCTQGPGITGLLYFLCNYFFIKTKEAGFKPVYPLWDSQMLLLDAIDRKWRTEQAVWFIILKARQLGISTVVEAILLYLTIFNKNWNSLLVADEPTQSEYLFEMARNGLESLPWFMKPERRYDVKGHHMIFDREDEQKRALRPGLKSALMVESANQRSGAGYGKAQSLDSLVLTPTGWLRMGDVRIGQRVIAGDGTEATVLGVFPQGSKELFRVTFSDGSSTECCDEHLWFTQTYNERKNFNRKLQSGRGRVRTLGEIRESLSARKGTHKNHSIPIVGTVSFARQPVPIAPYLMGVLLGDGGMTHALRLSSTDDDILRLTRESLPFGMELKRVPKSKCDWAIANRDGHKGRASEILAAVRRLGLHGHRSYEKFIPSLYLFNHAHIRLMVLQGLMDTDGDVHTSGHTAYYTTTSKQLAKDVTFLVRSLGGIAITSEDNNRHFSYKGKRKRGRLAYRLSVSMPAHMPPFRLARKAIKLKPKTKYPPSRYICKVESVGYKHAQCIMVDHPAHLYVTDDFIVTHNTISALHASEVPKYKDLRILTEGILPTIPEMSKYAFVILEGVALRRHDDWHRLWKAAEAGETTFEPQFINWFRESQYSRNPTTGWKPSNETAALYSQVKDEYKVELSVSQLYWYERKRNDYIAAEGDDATFLTQYPTSPSEAFQNAGICAFNKRKLRQMLLQQCRSPRWRGEVRLDDTNDRMPRLAPAQMGRLRIWEWPDDASRGNLKRLQAAGATMDEIRAKLIPPDPQVIFYIGGDPSLGVPGGDPACWQVIAIPSSPFEPLRQVACWHGYAGTAQFARIGAALGYMYGSAEICPEANGIGQGVIAEFKTLNYPNMYIWRREDKRSGYWSDFYGWSTTTQSKQRLIAKMSEGVDEDLIVIRDADTLDEAYDFVDEGGSTYYSISKDGHGDRFMALMFAFYCANQLRPFKERSQLREALMEQKRDPNKDFANTDYSPEYDKTEAKGIDFSML